MMKVLSNARIYTLNEEQPIASALIIEGERIRAIGNDEVIPPNLTAKDTIYDLGARTILPGLIDAHIHLEQYALGLQKVDCETDSRAECLKRVAERAQETPAGQWILGHGWNQNTWAEGFGDASDLDAIAPRHPVYLTAKSLHAAWANSTALRLAAITADTKDPPGGLIRRKSRGYPDGFLFESAMDLVNRVIPEPDAESVAAAIQNIQPQLWQMGLTGVHDFDRQRCFSALQILHARGNLRLRVLKSIPLTDMPNAIALGIRSGFGDDWLRIGSIKIFADGALGPNTAAMLQPYEALPENRGLLLVDAEELFEHGRQAAQNGLSLAVHAIGDRANHEVLKAFSQLRDFEKTRLASSIPLRHRIEHVQLIHPDDAPRLAKLDIIASMQPIHATSDMEMADRYWGRRAAFSYAWREQLKHGARLVFGSDAPVESPNPFLGLHAAILRRRIDGKPSPDGWYPGQRLSLDESLRSYTSEAAFAAGMEDRLGKLAPGFLADLLVLDENPFKCEPDLIHALHPQAVMIGGEWVWQA